jgi:hypothetical protein
MPNEYMQPFFDTLTQGVQVAQHLTNAALQMRQLEQEKQAQQQRQQLAQQEFDAQQQQSLGQQLTAGATPVRPDGTAGAGVPRPTTTTDPGTGQISTTFDQNNRQYFPADPSRTFTVAGHTLQAPTIQDQLDRQVAGKKALEDADRIPISDKLANAVGVPSGTKLSPEHMAGFGALARWLNPPPQDNSPTWQDFKDNDSGHVTRVWTDANGNVVKKSDIGKLVGEKAAGGDGSGKQLTPDALLGARQKAIADYQKASREEAELNQDRVAIGTALKSGQHYVDKNGNLKKFDPTATDEEKAAIQDNMRGLFEQKTNRLKQVISEKNDAMNRYGTAPQVSTEQATAALGQPGGKSAKPAVQAPAAPQAQAPAAPKQQAAATQKVASMADLQAYAKKSGKSLDEVKKMALSRGYQIGQ